MPVGGLDALTRLVLVDALYLEAPWAEPFEEAQTGDRAWELDDGTTVGVPMMSLARRRPRGGRAMAGRRCACSMRVAGWR